MAATNRTAVLVFVAILLILSAAATWWLLTGESGSRFDGPRTSDGGASAVADREDVDSIDDPIDDAGDALVPASGADARASVASDAAEGTPADGEAGFTVSGRIALPPGTPADEIAVVVALAERADLDRLDDLAPDFERLWRSLVEASDAPDAQHEARAPAGDAVRGAVRATSAGDFELAVEGGAPVHVVTLGRYVYALGSKRVEPEDADDVRLSVELGAWLTGHLVPPTGSADPADIEVSLVPDTLGGFDVAAMTVYGHRRDASTDGEGAFEIRGVPALGAYALYARPESYASFYEGELQLEPGRHLALRIALDLGATVRGVVVDTSDAPVPDAVVSARWTGGVGRVSGRLRATTSAADGTFELVRVGAGSVELRANAEGRLDVRQRVDGELAVGDVVDGLRLVLGRGGAIRGRVEYVDGTPAAEAEVLAELDVATATASGGMGMGMGLEDARGGTSACAEDGTFAISGVSEHPFRLVAEVRAPREEPSDGAATEAETAQAPPVAWRATKTDVRPSDTEHVLVLERLFELTGRVVDANTAEPVTDFRVRLMLEGSGGAFNIGAQRRDEAFDAAEDGLFGVHELDPGTWSVVAAADGYADSAPVVVDLPQEDGARIEIALRPAASAAGVVVDPFGAPVAGATIAPKLGLAERIEAQSMGTARTVFSESDGTFVLDGLAAGSLALEADHPDLAPSATVAVDLEPGTRKEGIVLTLREGGVLTGEVFGADGAPASGLLVSVQLTPDYARQHLVESDDDGRFRFERLAPGTWQVTAMPNTMRSGESPDPAQRGELFGQLKMATADVVDGETTHVVLGAPPSDPVTFTGVVLRAGEPVAGAMVSIVPETDGDAMGAMRLQVTDEAGRFATQLDAPAPLLLSVQSEFEGGVQNTVEFIELVPVGASEHAVVLELPGGSISGTVRDADGRAIPRARVSVEVRGGVRLGHLTGGNHVETATDEEGRYRATDLRAGEYAVSAGGASLVGMLGSVPTGGRVVRRGVNVGEDEAVTGIDLELPAAVELVGRVVDGSGAPVAGASVYVRRDDGSIVDRMTFVESDDAGRFRYSGLASGSYGVHARRGDRTSAEIGPVAIDEDRRGDVELVLAAGTLLSVKVVDPRSDDTRGVSVSVRDESEREYAGLFSLGELMQEMGAWFSTEAQRVGPVPPGTYTVTATHADGRSRDRRVVVDGGERTVVVRLR